MADCRAGCKEEFKCSNFGLTHPKPWLFVTTQWTKCRAPLVYVIYRIIMALYFTVWIILSGAWEYPWATTQANRVKWFIYLTNWSFFVLVVDLIVEAVVACHGFIKIGKCGGNKELAYDGMTWYLKMTWVLYNVATISAILISLLFWGVIYTPAYFVHPVDYNTHASNSIYALLNLFITAIPIRFYHFFHGMIYAVLFIIFSVIYTKAGGSNALDSPYIYSVLDWNNNPAWAAAYAILLGIVGVVILWLVLYALYHVRIAIYKCTHSEDDEKSAMTGRSRDLEMEGGQVNPGYGSIPE